VSPRVGRHIGALLTLLGALALSGLLVLAGLNRGRAIAEANPASAAGVDAVLAQPRSYLYRNVTLRGQVMRLWGGHVVALRSHSVRQGLLVVLEGQSASEANLHAGQRVEVVGEVRPLARAELQGLGQQLTADVSRETLLGIFGGDPYILAQEVRPVAGRSP